MYKFCVFAGTAEGRRLVEFLSTQPVDVTACVATEYGEELLSPSDNLTVSARPLPPEEIKTLLRQNNFDLVIDATHPYAAHITGSIAEACEASETEYLRLLRDQGTLPQNAACMDNADEAVEYLNATEGNFLLTTGSKNLNVFQRVRDFTQRAYVRVLPMVSSLEACKGIGLPPSHILAMQGPFSKEMNIAMLHAVSAKFLVTKDSGGAGGFAEKVQAAEETGAKLIVLGRPPQREGLSYGEVMELLSARFGLKDIPSVILAGIGPGGRTVMTAETTAAIETADCLIGAARMLDAASHPEKPRFAAIGPEDIAEYIHKHREYHTFAVPLSGDTGFFSGAKKLLPALEGCNVKVLPGISSLSYLCAKLGTSYEDVFPVSLHGRKRDIAVDVRAHDRVFALVGGVDGASRLCKALCAAGLGDVRIHIGERLSYPEERITNGTAEELSNGDFAPLSAVLIENPAALGRSVSFGLPDGDFQRNRGEEATVPMTKSEVRAVCLSKLRLNEKSICWDIGAGTGSVSVEMSLLVPKGQVFAIERKEEAVSLLLENREKFALNNLTVIHGTAPAVCEILPPPTHAFIGGSAGKLREIVALLLHKNPRVRIVATAVTLESLAELTACLKSFPFSYSECISLSVARSRPVGPYHLMTSQNPVHIFTFMQ